MIKDNFAWINFYIEFAEKLLPYAENRSKPLKR